MRQFTTILMSITLLASLPAHAINAKYREKLERSGCTQVSEMQGCDINKTKAENAKAGFITEAGMSQTTNHNSPYAGRWNALRENGATVARIRIDTKDQVWVNEKKVKAQKSDGALIFRAGNITYSIQGDRRIQGEDRWHDIDAGTTGPISAE